eukprot:CAMPEP_0115020002 /NCGR_PEP_ID=MMETSP0216-20121206/29824_1 /TAXON_ID=223996 /ORGANISM="Protocruzia adherens, Strain Boccale" /LENGTH=1039 /DNA_ID=CAMNT_0002391669 /DNA_START=186 /DNA_END=3305 /DNA_ORIENTATION=+
MTTELKTPLLDGDQEAGSAFNLPSKTIEDLFEVDSIEESKVALQKLGGVKAIMQQLHVSAEQGIIPDDPNTGLSARTSVYGTNIQKEKPVKGFFALCMEQFEDKILRILVVAAIVSLIVNTLEDPNMGWIEGTAIVFAICLVVFVSAGNDYIKEKQFRALNAKRDQREITCLRNGHSVSVSIFDLVVGDIAYLNTGEKLPVDAMVIQSSSLVADESSLTGETDPVKKACPTYKEPAGRQPSPFLISGSEITEGTGVMLICAVGPRSQLGKTKSKLEEEAEATPLQEKLEVIADDIGKLGVICALIVFVGLLIKFIIHNHSNWHWNEFASALIQYFILAVTIIVVAVPEGLPLAVTISLAYSVGQMKDENNLVRHLSACETMGGGNNICSDKTGTLTMNKMTVVNFYAEEQHFDNVHSTPKNVKVSEVTSTHLKNNSAVNSTAFIERDGTGWKQIGSKTECALLQMIHDLDADYIKIRRNSPSIGAIPFSSARKRMTTVIEDPNNSDNVLIYTKGAAEMVLSKCNTKIASDGSEDRLSDSDKSKIIDDVINSFAHRALRAICLAYKEMPKSTFEKLDLSSEADKETAEEGLTFVGIVGIQDPLRPEIVESVRQCGKAGIRVRMVTGDNIETAMAISKNAGILARDWSRETSLDKYACLEGKKFRELTGGLVPKDKEGKHMTIKNMEIFKQIAEQLRVLARSTPEDKYILVTGMRELGNVVAVTGDGTNDAPALKKSDVGFAMGIAGTEVAKEAADIILLDDNFSSIVTAVKWGRNIYDCIRKFLQFQLTVNIVALFMALIGSLILDESPLTPVQMLWVNLIMDTFASLALATEPPTLDLLNRPPYKRDDYLLTPQMLKNIIFQALYQIIVLSLILFFPHLFGLESSLGNNSTAHWSEKDATQYTVLFDAFVFMQVFNEINARKLKNHEINIFKGFFNNFLFLFILAITLVVQLLIVQFGNVVMKCAPLSIEYHGLSLAFGFGGLIVGVISKMFPEDLLARFLPTSDPAPDAKKKKTLSITSTLRSDTRSKIRKANTKFMK